MKSSPQREPATENVRTMKVVIRVDASVHIGTGHVMRCLTLANALRACGATVTFVCREHEGHLCEHLDASGFSVCRLPAPDGAATRPRRDDYVAWLGVPQDVDAEQTLACCHRDDAPADWLVVDHYGLDVTWENRVRSLALHTLVIDDIADRRHSCEILLDQNLNRHPEQRYRSLTPDHCRLLLGPQYALLREEFAVAASELRQRSGDVGRILIFFGGTDPSGETLKACRAVAGEISNNVTVDVVVGAVNRRCEDITRFCRNDARFRYHHRISNMAELIRDADLAVGAGGTTAWERTFLGLPTLTIAVAKNQVDGTEALAAQGAIHYLGTRDTVTEEHIAATLRALLRHPDSLLAMGQRCLDIYGPDQAPGVDWVLAAMDEVSHARA
jgi:UDP-2,4-diacetamido-2,4,6-trideoxy-beta-L-altropyranose hydrolase